MLDPARSPNSHPTFSTVVAVMRILVVLAVFLGTVGGGAYLFWRALAD